MLTVADALARQHLVPVASEPDGRRLDRVVDQGRVWWRVTTADRRTLTAASLAVALVSYNLVLPPTPAPRPEVAAP